MAIDDARRKVAATEALGSRFHEWGAWPFGDRDKVLAAKEQWLDWARKRVAARYAATADLERAKHVEPLGEGHERAAKYA